MLKEQFQLLQSLKQQGSNTEAMQAIIYRELLNRLHILISDFTMLSYALWGELEATPHAAVIGRIPSKVLGRFTDERWAILLRYEPIDRLKLNAQEKEFLALIRKKNISQANKFIELLNDFWKIYGSLENKLSHSHSLLFGFTEKIQPGSNSLLLPVSTNLKEPNNITGFAIDEATYLLWQRLYSCVTSVIQEITDRALLVIERQGRLLIEKNLFFVASNQEIKQLQELIKRLDKEITTSVPETNIKWKVHPESQASHNRFKTKMANVLDSFGY